MISDELLVRYHIRKERFESDLMAGYQTFLIQTDYVANKITEAMYLNKPLDEDYTEILQARQYAREQINILQDNK